MEDINQEPEAVEQSDQPETAGSEETADESEEETA